ncbi:IDEAL domain-containing protein [Bacillus sp. B190/17]|uniref:IDEAL domain-containing protein n=1 Tax=Bacillus lumedeiriae TaxID=3058829 RepID=A0ABW8I8L9_9BACI
MENNQYFTEMMKSPMPREKVKSATAAYIDSFLNGILFKQEKQKLMDAIDKSLDEGNRESFIELSALLNELEKKFKAESVLL